MQEVIRGYRSVLSFLYCSSQTGMGPSTVECRGTHRVFFSKQPRKPTLRKARCFPRAKLSELGWERTQRLAGSRSLQRDAASSRKGAGDGAFGRKKPRQTGRLGFGKASKAGSCAVCPRVALPALSCRRRWHVPVYILCFAHILRRKKRSVVWEV